jgi:hypothetical protein
MYGGGITYRWQIRGIQKGGDSQNKNCVCAMFYLWVYPEIKKRKV